MSHILIQIPIAITRLHIVNLTSIFSISLHIKQLVWNYKKTHGKHQKINWISKLGDSVEQQNCQAYRNSWTLDARVEHWALDAGLWTLDSGRWTLDAALWTLDAGRWTLDAGRWTLDSGRWTLDADFKGGPGIMLSELKRYLNYSTNKKQGRQFLYYREIRHKETKHNEPFKGVLKNSYSLGQNSPKNNNYDAFL